MFRKEELEPRLDEAREGKRVVVFMDAAHFVYGAFLGTVWCFLRVFLPSPSGRKRFNVLGALNAVSKEVLTLTNETYINAESVCQLLLQIVEYYGSKPITVVLDNARYQKCALVQCFAADLGVEFLFLPSYSPQLNLIVLKTTEAQLPDTVLQRTRFEHALAVLTGNNASSFHVAERPLDLALITIPADLPSELLERRPDIAAAERRMAAANANIGVAKAAFFPTIRFSGQTGLQSGDMGTLFSWPSRLWAAGPSLSQPQFEGGKLTANLHQAKATYEETVAKYRGTVLAAFGDVENNLAAEHLLASQHEKALAASQSADRQLEIANNRYRSGLITFLDVATAENAALGTERTCVRLRDQQLLAIVALIKSLGGGWHMSDFSTTVQSARRDP